MRNTLFRTHTHAYRKYHSDNQRFTTCANLTLEPSLINDYQRPTSSFLVTCRRTYYYVAWRE